MPSRTDPPARPAARDKSPQATLPLVVDMGYLTGFIRRGLLAYRVIGIFLSALLVMVCCAALLLVVGLVVAPAFAQGTSSGATDAAAAGSIVQIVVLVAMLGALVALLFALSRFAAARFALFAVFALPGFVQVLLGGIKLYGLGRMLLGGASFDAVAWVLLIQGGVLLAGGLFLLLVAGGLLATLRLDRARFAQVWSLGRAPLQIFNTPRWFYRLGPKAMVAVPVYVLLNAVFVCTAAFLFGALFAAPHVLDAALAQRMDALKTDFAYALGEATGAGLGTLGVAVALASGAGWLLRKGRQLGVAEATAIRARDRRAPVLFLRSFHDDQVFLGALKLPSLARLLSFETYPATLDAMLAHEAARVGPAIALGNPEDRKGISGVARDWVADGAWQERILGELDAARHVFLVVDDTPGTRWEIERIAEAPDWLARTVFLKPPRAAAGTTDLSTALAAAPGAGPLTALWALPQVFGVAMCPAGPQKVFVSRRPDALDYQCLLRDVL